MKNMDNNQFLSQEARILSPYTPGEQPKENNFIKLNTNESPFPPSPQVLDILSREEVGKLNLYPDPTCRDLTEAAAEYYDLKPENIIPGNGSDEILAFARYYLRILSGAIGVIWSGRENYRIKTRL